MNEILSAHRSELPHGEEASERYRAGFGPHGTGIVMRLGKQPCPSAIAGEHKGTGRALFMSRDIAVQQRMQVFVGRRRVPNVELDGLPDADIIRNGQGAAVAVQSQDVSNQEIAPLKLALMLVDDPADVQLQAHQWRTAAELDNDIVLGSGDDHVLSNRPTTLGDNAANRNWPLQEQTHGSLRPELIAQEQTRVAGPAAAARHTAHNA
jgi:hypothetical protein